MLIEKLFKEMDRQYSFQVIGEDLLYFSHVDDALSNFKESWCKLFWEQNWTSVEDSGDANED